MQQQHLPVATSWETMRRRDRHVSAQAMAIAISTLCSQALALPVSARLQQARVLSDFVTPLLLFLTIYFRELIRSLVTEQ
jgi:hypothetical protein